MILDESYFILEQSCSDLILAKQCTYTLVLSYFSCFDASCDDLIQLPSNMYLKPTLDQSIVIFLLWENLKIPSTMGWTYVSEECRMARYNCNHKPTCTVGPLESARSYWRPGGTVRFVVEMRVRAKQLQSMSDNITYHLRNDIF